MVNLEAKLDGEQTRCQNESQRPLLDLVREYAKTGYDAVTEKAANLLTNGRYEKLKQENESLRKTAATDPMTGLLNKAKFEEDLRAHSSIFNRHGTGYALALLDIDDFKNVNDLYGHHIGDLVINTLATYLSEEGRISDRSYRIGGEEFAVILPNTGQDGGKAYAEELRQKVEDNLGREVEKQIQQEIAQENLTSDVENLYREHGFPKITVSCGVAGVESEYSRDVCDKSRVENVSNGLYNIADSRLYRAKKNGRNQVCPMSPKIVGMPGSDSDAGSENKIPLYIVK